MYPFLAAGETGNMIFILRSLAENSTTMEEGVNEHTFLRFLIYTTLLVCKDCSNLYFPHLCQHRTFKIPCQINNSRKWSLCYFILRFPNFWWCLHHFFFLLKYILEVASEILSAELSGKPRFQDYRRSVGHASLPSIFQGCFVTDSSNSGSQECGPFSFTKYESTVAK